MTNQILTAIKNDDAETILSLLKKGTSIETTDEYGRTLLMLAIKHDAFSIIIELLKRHANVNAISSGKETWNKEGLYRVDSGETPLSIAIKEGNISATKLLLKEKLLPRILNEGFILACQLKNKKIVAEFLKIIKNVNFTIKETSPLIEASIAGDLELIELLLKNGADANLVINKCDYTSFMQIIKLQKGLKEDAKILKLLISHNAALESVDNWGWTPLLLAIVVKNIIAVKTLIESGANIQAKDIKGNTAFSLAKETNNQELIQLVEQYK